MSALRDAIDRSFVVAEHPDPVVSPHRPLGRRRLGGLGLLGQAVSTTAPVASMMALVALMHRLSHPWVSLAIASVVAIGMCVVAACISQLSARMAATGGLYSFVATALGPKAAGAVAAGLLIKFLGSASMSVMHLVLVISAIAAATGIGALSLAASVPVALAAVTVVVAVVVGGVRQAGWVLLALEVCSLAFLLGCLMLPDTTTIGPLPPVPGSELQRIVMVGVFALAGFESAAFFGPEARRGLITTTRVIRYTPILCGALVLIAGLAAALGRGDAVVSAYLFGTERGAPAGLVVALHLALACSWLGTITGSANGVTRLVYTLGVEAVLPGRLGQVHRRWRTPVRAAVLVGAAIAVGGTTLTLAGPSSVATDTVSAAARVALLVAYVFTVAGTVVLLRRLGELTATNAVLATLAGLGLGAMLTAIVGGELRHGTATGALVVIVLLAAGPAWMLALRLIRPHRSVRVGVIDQPESEDALPGAVEVRRRPGGRLELSGRPDEPMDRPRWRW